MAYEIYSDESGCGKDRYEAIDMTPISGTRSWSVFPDLIITL